MQKFNRNSRNSHNSRNFYDNNNKGYKQGNKTSTFEKPTQLVSMTSRLPIIKTTIPAIFRSPCPVYNRIAETLSYIINYIVDNDMYKNVIDKAINFLLASPDNANEFIQDDETNNIVYIDIAYSHIISCATVINTSFPDNMFNTFDYEQLINFLRNRQAHNEEILKKYISIFEFPQFNVERCIEAIINIYSKEGIKPTTRSSKFAALLEDNNNVIFKFSFADGSNIEYISYDEYYGGSSIFYEGIPKDKVNEAKAHMRELTKTQYKRRFIYEPDTINLLRSREIELRKIANGIISDIDVSNRNYVRNLSESLGTYMSSHDNAPMPTIDCCYYDNGKYLKVDNIKDENAARKTFAKVAIALLKYIIEKLNINHFITLLLGYGSTNRVMFTLQDLLNTLPSNIKDMTLRNFSSNYTNMMGTNNYSSRADNKVRFILKYDESNIKDASNRKVNSDLKLYISYTHPNNKYNPGYFTISINSYQTMHYAWFSIAPISIVPLQDLRLNNIIGKLIDDRQFKLIIPMFRLYKSLIKVNANRISIADIISIRQFAKMDTDDLKHYDGNMLYLANNDIIYEDFHIDDIFSRSFFRDGSNVLLTNSGFYDVGAYKERLLSIFIINSLRHVIKQWREGNIELTDDELKQISYIINTNVFDILNACYVDGLNDDQINLYGIFGDYTGNNYLIKYLNQEDKRVYYKDACEDNIFASFVCNYDHYKNGSKIVYTLRDNDEYTHVSIPYWVKDQADIELLESLNKDGDILIKKQATDGHDDIVAQVLKSNNGLVLYDFNSVLPESFPHLDIIYDIINLSSNLSEDDIMKVCTDIYAALINYLGTLSFSAIRRTVPAITFLGNFVLEVLFNRHIFNGYATWGQYEISRYMSILSMIYRDVFLPRLQGANSLNNLKERLKTNITNIQNKCPKADDNNIRAFTNFVRYMTYNDMISIVFPNTVCVFLRSVTVTAINYKPGESGYNNVMNAIKCANILLEYYPDVKVDVIDLIKNYVFKIRYEDYGPVTLFYILFLFGGIKYNDTIDKFVNAFNIPTYDDDKPAGKRLRELAIMAYNNHTKFIKNFDDIMQKIMPDISAIYTKPAAEKKDYTMTVFDKFASLLQ